MVKKTFSKSIDAREHETFQGVFTAHDYLIIHTDENALLFICVETLKIRYKIQLNDIAPIKIIGNNLFVCFSSYTECYRITKYGMLIKGKEMPPTKHIAQYGEDFCISGDILAIYDKSGERKKFISEKTNYVNSYKNKIIASFWYNDICFLDENLNQLKKIDIEFAPYLHCIIVSNYIYITNGFGCLKKIAF